MIIRLHGTEDGVGGPPEWAMIELQGKLIDAQQQLDDDVRKDIGMLRVVDQVHMVAKSKCLWLGC
jgi:hypothetical protein